LNQGVHDRRISHAIAIGGIIEAAIQDRNQPEQSKENEASGDSKPASK
jgi:hypothetical protein